jgi:hypothetical protein
MAIVVSYVRDMIPPAMPHEVVFHIEKSLCWLEQMESREQGDPRQIQATLHSILATIGVYQIAAETARRVR